MTVTEWVLKRLTDGRARRVMIGVLAVLGMGSVLSNALALQAASQAQRDVAEGRAVALEVICTYGSAIGEAGRAVISASAREPRTEREKRFEANLQRLGYPPLEQRRQAAKLGGAAYVEAINRRVEKETRIDDLVIEKGPRAGSLDCERLKEAAQIK